MNSSLFPKALLLPLLLAPLLAGCDDLPDEEEVKKDFLKDHPGLEVIRVHPALGNEQTKYYQIDYREPKNAEPGTMRIIYYQDPESNTWHHGVQSDHHP